MQLARTICIFFLLSPLHAISQTVSGTIENLQGDKILSANVMFKDSLGAIAIKEFTIARNGSFDFTLKKSYRTLVIEVTANGYRKEIFAIENAASTKTYHHKFFLQKDTVQSLEKVIVTAKARPFQVRGDTVSYNVAAYRDGTERKIQDVIKKLPGIEVNEKTGEIKYKGKPVETVKLDGEDLFASNYSIGTKNINVDLVEQVQAIENYSDNPLLKGIEAEEKVALNLTLKNKKAEYSGSLDLGAGLLGSGAALDLSTNVLGISKKYKSFATASYNNIGQNNSPFDYFSYTPGVERQREEMFMAQKYIPDTYFNTGIDESRNHINHSLFGSYNAAFKLNQRFNLKTNFYYLSDRINSNQSSLAANQINGQKFLTSDLYSIQKKPEQYRGDLEAKYLASENSLLEYTIRYRIENILTKNEMLQNDLSHYYTSLKTKDNFLKQTAVYTHKLAANKAIQIMARHSMNDIPQNFIFNPAIYNASAFTSNQQKSHFNKDYYNLQASLMGNSKTSAHKFILGTEFHDIGYASALTGTANNNEVPINGFSNKFNYRQKMIYAQASYKLKLKKIRLMPGLNLSYLNQEMIASVKKSIIQRILLEPSLSVHLKIGNYSGFLVSASLRQRPFSEEYLIEQPVFISNRVIRSNEQSLSIQKNKVLSAYYVLNNLYQQVQFQLGTMYVNSQGNYFSDLSIDQNSTYFHSFFLPEANKFFSLAAMIEKYVDDLQGTIRLNTDYSVQQYKNIVNGSSLRDNVSTNLTSKLFFKTAFDGKFNFENEFRYSWIKSLSEASPVYVNKSLGNVFKIIVRPSKALLFLLSTDYIIPGLGEKHQDYLFFDADISYHSKNKLYDLGLRARNMSNVKYLKEVETNDYSIINYQTDLLPLHFIFRVSRNF